ncbi:MAG: aldo/keto reductase [Spirochaetales bacterium]|nr:aldo/keto reductase [Spirochaetales bacterium]
MISKAIFGRTGHNSTRTLFGAASLAQVSQADADRTLDLLFQYGINHIDTAASYGEAELRIGPWMPRHRDKFFLATKTEKRTYKEAMAELENSRKRLQSDVIDLWQMHVLVDEEGWQTAFGPDGALKAFIEAKEKGWVRYLGVTGHGVQAPDFHKRSLEAYPFDSVLLPWNYPMSLNREYSLRFRELTEICREKEVVVQTIKGICRRPWPEGKKNRATWYEPLEEQEDINTAVAYILKDPQFFLNTAGDIDVLPRVLKAASDFCDGKIVPPGDDKMARLLKEKAMTPLFHS